LSNKLYKMKNIPLFPYSFRKIGITILVPALILGIAYSFYDFNFNFLSFPYTSLQQKIDLNDHNFTNELAAISLIISLLFIAFSKEKIEDEAITHFRLEALQWAVYANYLILIVSILLVYGGSFFSALIYNMFTTLIIFIIRFRYILFQSKKMTA
jgi:hypothetical protein